MNESSLHKIKTINAFFSNFLPIDTGLLEKQFTINNCIIAGKVQNLRQFFSMLIPSLFCDI